MVIINKHTGQMSLENSEFSRVHWIEEDEAEMIRVRVCSRKMPLFPILRRSHKEAVRISRWKCYRVRISGSYRDFFTQTAKGRARWHEIKVTSNRHGKTWNIYQCILINCLDYDEKMCKLLYSYGIMCGLVSKARKEQLSDYNKAFNIHNYLRRTHKLI